MVYGPWAIDFLISKLLIALLRKCLDFCKRRTATGDIIIILQFTTGDIV
ncbi:hypothetical protein SAMN05444277_10140 [Parafilimonas terrae]|uniref:Uncharacterized protein n=1 Tax=Parafilimonas terrae TaxID=1465490 RepID=A0A1I5R343_9BACT|nr:hypothetical protein SAMN05444277_10140 [Parafilimonas terrae]